jgi:hypothetical protein
VNTSPLMSNLTVSLIDFGLSHSYHDSLEVLKKGYQHNKDMFKGSLLFCSLNLLKGECKLFIELIVLH